MSVTTFPLSRSVGPFNGVAEVVIVPSPVAGVQRMVRTIYISNRDSVPITVTLSYAFGVGRARIWKGLLDPLDTLMFGEGDALILSNTTDSIVAVLDAPSTTTEPDYTSSWGDRTVTS